MHSAAHATATDGIPLSTTMTKAVNARRFTKSSIPKRKGRTNPALDLPKVMKVLLNYGHWAATILMAVSFM